MQVKYKKDIAQPGPQVQGISAPLPHPAQA